MVRVAGENVSAFEVEDAINKAIPLLLSLQRHQYQTL